MMFDAFDILKKLPDGGIVWMESAKDLETAKARIRLFATYKPGEYVIFCQQTQSVITMPWVTFARQDEGNKAGAKKPREKPKTQPRSKTRAKAKASQVIAEIVADIARTLRH
jgi:hypothetical protein